MTKIKILVNLEDKSINETLLANEVYDFTVENGFLKVNFPSGKHYTLISEEYKGKFFEYVEVEEPAIEKSIEAIAESEEIEKPIKKKKRDEDAII